MREQDFDDFDLLLAMDSANLARAAATGAGERAGAREVRLLREFDPASAAAASLDVPDPYYGADGGFDEVLDLVQAACAGLLAQIRSSGEL